jgi:hypothetical protein
MSKTQTLHRGALLVALAVFPLASCTNMSRNSAYAQDKTITLQEWNDWASDITSAVISAPNFNRYPSPVTLAIGDFTNSSPRMDVAQDKDVFLNALQRTLINTGRATVTRLYAGNAGRTDSVTRASGELTQDPQFRAGATSGMDNMAEAAALVLSLQFNQKRTVNRGGDNVYENFFHIELIDQRSKTVIYSDDVFKTKKE